MDVRVSLQQLSPGVQNAEEADLDAETPGIGGHFQECGSGGPEQEGEQDSLVSPDQRDKGVRDAEDNVKVTDGQQFLLSLAEPLLACVDLTLWAVSISTRMERDGLIPAATASIPVPA